MLNKNHTARSFSKAAALYDRKALWQKDVAQYLLQFVPPQFSNALDLGCGTGTLALNLQKINPAAEIHGIDIAEGMIYEALKRSIKEKSPEVLFNIGDMEHIPYPDESFDLVVSNLSLQWLDEPNRCFAEVQRVLRPEGRFIFTTLIDGSMPELQEAYAAIQHTHSHPLISAERIKEALNAAGLIIFGLEMFTDTLYFKTFPELLESIRGIGAKAQNTQPLTKTKLQKLTQAYAHETKGYPVSYDVILCTALKIAVGYN